MSPLSYLPSSGRALRDRGADLKRKSSTIFGNLVTMVSDRSALVPYLPQVYKKYHCLSTLLTTITLRLTTDRPSCPICHR